MEQTKGIISKEELSRHFEVSRQYLNLHINKYIENYLKFIKTSNREELLIDKNYKNGSHVYFVVVKEID